MPHSLKTGKVVIVLAGRYAGRKAVIVNAFDEGLGDRKFGVCLIAGIDRPPRKITKDMGKKKTDKRSKMKPFVKYVNYNHIMPTRYQVDITESLSKELSGDGATLTDREKIHSARKGVKAVFESRYKTQGTAKSERMATGTSYLFKRLRF